MANERAQLVVGDEAWCVFTRSKRGQKQRTLTGVGRVRVVDIDEPVYFVEVLLAAGSHPETLKRCKSQYKVERRDLYATSGPEHAEFGAFVQSTYRDGGP